MHGSCMTRQARRGLTSLLPLWRPTEQLRGSVASMHTQLIALRQVDDALLAVAPAVDRWRLFFVLISAVVGQSLWEEGRAIRPHCYQLTRPMAVAELWTVTADHQLDLRFYQM